MKKGIFPEAFSEGDYPIEQALNGLLGSPTVNPEAPKKVKRKN